MERFKPLDQYRLGSVVASALALACAVYGVFIPAALVTALLFSLSAGLLYFLWTRPVIEVNDVSLTTGGMTIRWYEIAAVETTGWHSPLVVKLTLYDDRKIRLIHPGHVRSSERLLQRIRRNSRDATIDGELYAEFWGETAPIRADIEARPARRPRLLRAEDEAEIEEIFRQLRTADQADRATSSDDVSDA